MELGRHTAPPAMFRAASTGNLRPARSRAARTVGLAGSLSLQPAGSLRPLRRDNSAKIAGGLLKPSGGESWRFAEDSLDSLLLGTNTLPRGSGQRAKFEVEKVLGKELGHTIGHRSRRTGGSHLSDSRSLQRSHSSGTISSHSWLQGSCSLSSGSTKDFRSTSSSLSTTPAGSEADLPFDPDVAMLLGAALDGSSALQTKSSHSLLGLSKVSSGSLSSATCAPRTSSQTSTSSLASSSAYSSLQLSENESNLPFDDEVARVLGLALGSSAGGIESSDAASADRSWSPSSTISSSSSSEVDSPRDLTQSVESEADLPFDADVAMVLGMALVDGFGHRSVSCCEGRGEIRGRHVPLACRLASAMVSSPVMESW